VFADGHNCLNGERLWEPTLRKDLRTRIEVESQIIGRSETSISRDRHVRTNSQHIRQFGDPSECFRTERRRKTHTQKEEGKLIHRDALILRKKTGETLVTAKSRFFVANLPSVMVGQLRKRNLGIGSIITRNQIETFRKIVKIGYNSNSGSVFRYYKIIHHGKVAIEIKEHFSVDIGSKLGLSF